MDRKALIMAELARTQAGLSPGELAKRMGISRQAVSRHLKELLAAGVLTKQGRTRNTRYLVPGWGVLFSHTLERPFPSEDRVFKEHILGALGGLTPEAQDISGYVFTEMLNNAIDHAAAAQIQIQLLDQGATARLVVADDGVGCFENIRGKANLPQLADAVAHLSKGKQTTAPEAHSGEGIFFSSKAADLFTLESNGLRWQVDNLRGDTGVGLSEVTTGTRVTWDLDRGCQRPLASLFSAYAVEEHAFDRTRIHIKLFERGDAFISRSEAKRLTAGLEGFTEIILDYKDVRIIGQGFGDQVYRVYQAANPAKRLISINAAEPVAMMIRRAGSSVI